MNNPIIAAARALGAALLLGLAPLLLTGCGTREAPPLAGAKLGGPFTLTDQDGRKVSDSDFAGKYRLIYFGYTFCPDICPTDVQTLMRGYRKLAADLMASERPKGLNELELEQYGILLEEQSTPFEDKALDLYIANANLAKQNIYDDSVRKSFDALAKLSPGRYNKREQPETFVDVIY